MTTMHITLIIFAVTYVLMIVFQKFRPLIAVAAAAVFLISGLISPGAAFGSPDNWNVILMIAGTMGTVALTIKSKMPALLADILVEKASTVKWATVVLSLFAGIVSAFIDNVATVLMIAPVALAIAKKFDVNPVRMIIAIAVSSNLQGAATLVGDTTSIMLGNAAGMDFLDFFVFKGKPGIFFAVELGALVSILVLMFVFRKDNTRIKASGRTKVEDYVPSFLLVLTVLLLIAASVIPDKHPMTNGFICVAVMVVGIVYDCIKNRSVKAAWETIKEIDYQTIILLIGLFVVIGALEYQGVIEKIAEVFGMIGNGNPFLVYTAAVWLSVLASAFIDNIPYVATMLPVMARLAVTIGIGDPTVLMLGMISGATLGGNLTPIGASANIAGIGILRKEGYEVKNSDFLKIGIPFTLAAIIPAYIFIWIFYGI